MSSSSATQSFDLRATVERDQRANRFRLIRGWALIGVGLFLVATGILVALFSVTATGPVRFASGGTVAGVGVGIAAMGWLQVYAWRHSPARLEVGPDGFVVTRVDSARRVVRGWDARDLVVTLWDTSMSPDPPAPKMRGCDYFLSLGMGENAAIPESAYDALLAVAASRGLSVEHTEFRSLSGQVTTDLVTIQSRRRAMGT
jgi:hypothetical protein